MLRGAGVPTPEAAVLTTPDVSKVALAFPLIVKPAREDASVGITADSVVHDRAALERQVTFVLARYRQPALVERYIEGREIYVSLLGRPDGGVQNPPALTRSTSQRCRRAARASSRSTASGTRARPSSAAPSRSPARGSSASTLARIAEVAETAFVAMELRDYARLDVRLSADGTPYIIDVNPNCDLSEGAGFARAARAAGLGYDEVVRRIVDLALQRRPHADTIPFTARTRAVPRTRPDNRPVLSTRPARRGARSG